MSKCDTCNSELSDTMEKCPTCGKYLGVPNVREITHKEEVKALTDRYENALGRAKSKGTNNSVSNFEEAIKETRAVINIDRKGLHFFVTSDRSIYSTYELQVTSEIRKPAEPEDDRKRRSISSSLFGSYAEEIRYAALALDGQGPISYGEYTMGLRDVAIEDRATLLEDNSFVFFKNNPTNGPIPAGYRAVWTDRHKLAVAKLSDRILENTPEKEYAKILLNSNGDRKTDEFIEVHIFGGFDRRALESVKGTTPRRAHERAFIVEVKEYLMKSGTKWIEK